jgi:hypothetical protein
LADFVGQIGLFQADQAEIESMIEKKTKIYKEPRYDWLVRGKTLYDTATGNKKNVIHLFFDNILDELYAKGWLSGQAKKDYEAEGLLF